MMYKTKEPGPDAKVWMSSTLDKYARQHAHISGNVCLASAAKATIWRIFPVNEIKHSVPSQIKSGSNTCKSVRKNFFNIKEFKELRIGSHPAGVYLFLDERRRV